MTRQIVVPRLGPDDTRPLKGLPRGYHVTDVQFIEGSNRLGYGIGDLIEKLRTIGLAPSEVAVDLALLAGAVTAADTRVSRDIDSEDRWTRQIAVHVPVSSVELWRDQAALLQRTLNFLTGDRWSVTFRARPARLSRFVGDPDKQRDRQPDCVCLFSGGLDSFIGAVDLLANGAEPLLVSHYWDGITSSSQTVCAKALAEIRQGSPPLHVRARVGFRKRLVSGSADEDTLRARSFLFFALGVLAATGVGADTAIKVPENGLISLNVPLDPLRLGALSTRTTHPYYMARFNEVLSNIGLGTKLDNDYRHFTKGEMVAGCKNPAVLRDAAALTMSCSSPAKARWRGVEPMHCGYCVPCLIRRASLAAGGGVDGTQYSVPVLPGHTLDTTKSEGEHVRSFHLALRRIAKFPQLARFDIHRPGPLSDHQGDLSAYEGVYVRGLQEVGRFLDGVKACPR